MMTASFINQAVKQMKSLSTFILPLLGLGAVAATDASTQTNPNPNPNSNSKAETMMSRSPGYFFPAVQSSESMAPSQRLHLILLGVENVERSRKFYEALGWAVSPTGADDFVKIDLGGQALILFSAENFAEEVFGEKEERGQAKYSGIAFAHLVKKPEQVGQILSRALQAGATLVKPTSRTPWGINAFFKDPDGFLFEIDYEDVWVFDQQDRLVVDKLNE
jgi:hypothetical protein